MVSVERTAAYYIVATGILGLLGLLLLAFRDSPNQVIFGFVGLGSLVLGYCYWNYWR